MGRGARCRARVHGQGVGRCRGVGGAAGWGVRRGGGWGGGGGGAGWRVGRGGGWGGVGGKGEGGPRGLEGWGLQGWGGRRKQQGWEAKRLGGGKGKEKTGDPHASPDFKPTMCISTDAILLFFVCYMLTDASC